MTRNKNNILLDIKASGHRLVVKKDLYNWIVLFGSPKQADEVFEKNAEHWFFVDLENMMTKLFRILLRLKVRSLEHSDVLDAIDETKTEIKDMCDTLMNKGMENGWKTVSKTVSIKRTDTESIH